MKQTLGFETEFPPVITHQINLKLKKRRVILKHSTQETAAVKHLRANPEDLRGFNHLNISLVYMFLHRSHRTLGGKCYI